MVRRRALLAALATAWVAQADHVADVLHEAGATALPHVLDAVEAARTAGVDSDTLEAASSLAKIRAGADLSLLSEITALAGDCLNSLSTSFRTSVYASGAAGAAQSVKRIVVAMESARRAGLPEEEITAARGVLHMHVRQAIDVAKAAFASGATDAKMGELAHLINIGHTFACDPEVLAGATEVFEQQLQGPFAAADVGFVVAALRHAGPAKANVPAAISDWPGAVEVVAKASTLAEDLESYPDFVAAIRQAKQAGLPQTDALTQCQSKAQAVAASSLNSTAAQTEDETSHEYVRRLLGELASAEDSGTEAASLAGVRAAAQAVAAQEVVDAVASNLANVHTVNSALSLAEDAGLSTVAASRASVHAQVQTRLATAKANVESACTAQTIQELGTAIFIGRKLAYSPQELETARALYKSQLEGSFAASDMPFVERAVDFADHAVVRVPSTLLQWVQANKLLREAAADPDESEERFEALVAAIRTAQEVALPRTSELISAESKAQAQATAKLNSTVAESPALEELLEAVEAAAKATVPSSDLTAARAQAQTLASTELNQAIAVDFSDVQHVHTINKAFELARRAGVSAQDQATARATSNTKFQAVLDTAKSSVEANPQSIPALTALANAGYIGRKMHYDAAELSSAAAVYENVMAGTFNATDMPFVESAVRLADFLAARAPRELLDWAGLARRIRERLPEADQDEYFEAAVELTREASRSNFPETADFASLKDKVKTKATGKLVQAVSGDDAAAIASAISAAVQAGVPESNLNDAQAVLKAQGMR